MVRIEKATQTDYDNIVDNAIEEALKMYPPMDISTNDLCCAGWHNDTLLAVAGFQVYWPGVVYTWISVSKDSLAMPIETVRAMNRMLAIVEKDLEIVRLQCTVRTDFKKAIELVEHLQFKREGTMIKYCPDGCNAYMYGKIIK